MVRFNNLIWEGASEMIFVGVLKHGSRECQKTLLSPGIIPITYPRASA
ncbi:MAG: hypothetical protein Q8P89_00145 [bacterium]|nr:hypothetical protein [bacterium]